MALTGGNNRWRRSLYCAVGWWLWLLVRVPSIHAWKVHLFRGAGGSNAENSFESMEPAKLFHPEHADSSSTASAASGSEDPASTNGSSSSTAFDPSAVPAAAVIWEFVKRILCYKPPVGIVMVWLLVRFLRLLFGPDQDQKLEDVLVTRHPKAAVLDRDDKVYCTHGGIEHLRKTLCGFGWENVPPTRLSAIAQAALGPLSSNDRFMWMQTVIPFVVELQKETQPGPAPSRRERIRELWNRISTDSTLLQDDTMCSLTESQVDELLLITHWTCQLRLTDALLRLCRDSLLKTTHRLARLVDYWKRRIQSQQSRVLFRFDLETDRLRLSLVQASYEDELKRLGVITHALMQRPKELDESALIRAIQYTQSRSCKTNRQIRGPWILQWWSKYSVRLGDGRGLFSIRKYNESDAFIDGPAAVATLLQENDPWVDQARQWTLGARKVIGSVVYEIVESSPGLPKPYNLQEFKTIREEFSSTWCDEDNWQAALSYAANLSSWLRVGEGHKVRLRDAFGLKNLLVQLDFFRIPSSFFLIYLAYAAHQRLVLPFWAPFRNEIMEAFKRMAEIFEQRVNVPLRDIYDDIMNKDNSGIMSEMFVLDAEELVLDHMLRDLNLGDGTPASRQEALLKANELYEQDFSRGVLTNVIRGRLLQLLLIQMQQLKVGLLSALDTIDVLMRGNRIHFKVLAAVPFIVLATVGTRYCFRALYNIRAKDIRPVTSVHSEMLRYLERIEHLFLSGTIDGTKPHSFMSLLKQRMAPSQKELWETTFDPVKLGELCLNMHRYLVLLDFSSPPFPAKNCDQIRFELRNLLGNEGSLKRFGPERHLQLLKLSKEKHQELLKRL